MKLVNQVFEKIEKNDVIYLEIPCYIDYRNIDDVKKYIIDSKSIVSDCNKYILTDISQFTSNVYITTTLNNIYNKGWADDLKYQSPKSNYHYDITCYNIISSIGVYNKILEAYGKYNFINIDNVKHQDLYNVKHIEFIIPSDTKITKASISGWDPCSSIDKLYLMYLKNAEGMFFELIKKKDINSGKTWSIAQAYNVLPGSVKIEFQISVFECSNKILNNIFNLLNENI